MVKVNLFYSIFLMPKRQTEAMPSNNFRVGRCIQTILSRRIVENTHRNVMAVLKIAGTSMGEKRMR